jgi:hypothetical protein
MNSKKVTVIVVYLGSERKEPGELWLPQGVRVMAETAEVPIEHLNRFLFSHGRRAEVDADVR